MDSKTEFLPWEVLFDSLRSATLNPFVGVGLSSKTVLGSTHTVEQLLFPMLPSFLTLDFEFILGLFFHLGAYWTIFGENSLKTSFRPN